MDYLRDGVGGVAYEWVRDNNPPLEGGLSSNLAGEWPVALGFSG